MSIISVKNLSKSFGSLQVLKDVSLEVEEGERIVIIGSSGCGKSVFLRSLDLLERPDSGTIAVDGDEITAKGADVDMIRRKMGMVYQGFHLFEHLNVLDNITLAPIHLKKMPRNEAESRAAELLRMVGLEDRKFEMPSVLSGGQKQRVAIVRCLAMDPKIMLFDEPTSALDPTMVGEVLATMRLLAKQGMTMIIVTHEMSFAAEVATRVLYFDEMGIYEEGTPKEIFDDPKRPKTSAFIRKLKYFSYHIESRNFDIMKIRGGIQTFAEKYGIDNAVSRKLQLCAEELICLIFESPYRSNIVDIDLDIGFSEKERFATLLLKDKAPEFNPFEAPDAADHLGIMILNKSASDIEYSYVEGTNIVKMNF